MGFKTQRALAEKMKLDTSRVNRWENGENLPEGVYKEALIKTLKADESLFDIEDSIQKFDFTVAASFLSKFEDLPPEFQCLVLSMFFRDPTYMKSVSASFLEKSVELLKELQIDYKARRA